MKKKIRITPLELVLIIIEFIILSALIVSTRVYFKGNIQNIIASIVSILISTYLTIVNRKKLFMPYFLIENNLFLMVLLGSGFNNDNTLEPSILKFRLIAAGVTAILCSLNYKVYDKVYINE